jgi:hypothetical protein
MNEAELEARRRMLEAALSSGKATADEKAELDAAYRRQDKLNEKGYKTAPTTRTEMGKGKLTFKKGGSVGSASRRADGIASRGKTKGKFV